MALTWFLGFLVLALTGCGQKGPLYIPKNDPAAAQRATLPQALLNTVRTSEAPKSPVSAASVAAPAAVPPPALPDIPDIQ